MRNKKIFSFDEEKDVEKIILNGFEGGFINYTQMYVVAKYFRDKFGYGEVRLEKELISFCKKQDINFNPITEASAIKKWIHSAMNYGLRKIEEISISQKDIDFLRSIENQKERKLLFATLIMAKASKQGNTKRNKDELKHSDNYYIKTNMFSNIIQLSGMKHITERDLYKVFYKYKNCITLYNPEQELIRVDFIDKSQENAICVSTNNILETYSVLLNNSIHKEKDKILFCVLCGKELSDIHTTKKYCEECSKKKVLEHKRLWWNKNKGKSN